jgi:hypothetical protein
MVARGKVLDDDGGSGLTGISPEGTETQPPWC